MQWGKVPKLEHQRYMHIFHSYHHLGQGFYQENRPETLKNPELIIYNQPLADSLQLTLETDESYLAEIFSGNQLFANAKPISLAYAGHQFGHFVPQLGDGRAVLLGEVLDKDGDRFDIQLKGSGRSVFSRRGDGKCPLDAAIREYIVSEAMHYLHIPTTRSLALVTSDDVVQRESLLPASVITRVAKSHIRIGTFEYFAMHGDLERLKKLADYTINRHFPEHKDHEKKYLSLLQSVIDLQLELVASWMSIGFIHGVMNTDNTLICGQTIDYGPCAFMDEYQRNKVFSYIDQHGRYGFSNQKNIILWNVMKFAEAILPLMDKDIKTSIKMAEKELHRFPTRFDAVYYQKMLAKIGIFDVQNHEDDQKLIDDFLLILEKNKIDFTSGFRVLSKVLLDKSAFHTTDSHYLNWQKKWLQRLQNQALSLDDIAAKMDSINPILIPRNHIVQNIIDEIIVENNVHPLHALMKAINDPFTEKEEYQQYYAPAKENEKVTNTFCGT